MRKTLLITLDFAPQVGGIATYWANLCQYLPAENLVVLAPETDNSLAFDAQQSYLIYRYRLLGSKHIWPQWLPFLFYTLKIIRQEKIKQIIVGQILPGGSIALLLKIFFRIPYFISLHGLDIVWANSHFRKRILAKLILQEAEGLISNSRFTQTRAQQLCPKLPVKTVIIYPCPNQTLLSLSPQAAEFWKDKLKLYRFVKKRVLLTIGRLVARKGQDKVIEAMTELHARYPDLVYLIVGQGAYLSALKRIVHQKKLEKVVYFFTEVPDSALGLFYQMADIFIMPARQLADGDVEGFGIVYLEANMFSKPVIAGRSGGVPEAVIDGYTGLLVNPLDVSQIVKAVIQLIDDRQMADLLGQQGARRVNKEFDWQKQARKLKKILY